MGFILPFCELYQWSQTGGPEGRTRPARQFTWPAKKLGPTSLTRSAGAVKLKSGSSVRKSIACKCIMEENHPLVQLNHTFDSHVI